MPGHYPLNYDPAPSVNPSGAPEGDYERIQTSPDMFGGLTAKALGTFGTGLETASQQGFETITQQAQMDARTHAAELHSWQSDQVTDAQEKFLQLRGKAALDALPDFKKSIDDIHQQARSQAGNPYTAQLVDSEGRRLTDITYAGAARHAASQRATWEANTAKDSSSSYGNSAVLSAAQSQEPNVIDDPVVSDRLFKSDQEVRNFAGMNGYEGDALDQEVAKNRGKNVTNIVKQLTSDDSHTGLQRAIDFYHSQNDSIDAASRVNIDNYLKSKSAVYDGQTAVKNISGLTPAPQTPMQIASRFVGANEHDQRDVLTKFIAGVGGQNIDPTKTPWCAAFVNAVLRSAGIQGTGSLAARSFLNVGREVGDNPQQGDVVVLSRGDPSSGLGHVGFYVGPGATPGTVRLLAGNTNGGVGYADYPSERVLGIRRVTDGDIGRTPLIDTSAQQNPLPPKSYVLDKIAHDPYLMDHPHAMDAAITFANKTYEVNNASFMETERALKINAEKQKAMSDDTENTYLKDLYSDTPKASITSIVNDDRLTHEAKTRLIHVAETADDNRKAEKTYGPGFYDAYKNVHAPAGDPNRITDPTQLYARVGAHGDLTVAGVDKLVQEIQSRKTPDGVSESEMKKQFLANAKSQISGTSEGLHIKDPKGDELFLKFMAQVLPLYDAERRKGKSAESLLNPDSPDYVGKAISTFRRPMDQWYSDLTGDNKPATAGGFDMNSIKTVQDAVVAYRNNQITKAQADQIAVDRGWGVRAPAVPQSR